MNGVVCFKEEVGIDNPTYARSARLEQYGWLILALVDCSKSYLYWV